MAARNVFINGKQETNAVRSAVASHSIHTNGVAEEVSFPYAFPKPGPYRLWVQMKSDERILTGVFEVNVGARGE